MDIFSVDNPFPMLLKIKLIVKIFSAVVLKNKIRGKITKKIISQFLESNLYSK